jgi:FixJ family two-component response regulator
MTEAKPAVLIIYHDQDVRDSLQSLLRSVALDSVKIRREHLMRKMGLSSASDLAGMADELRDAGTYR